MSGKICRVLQRYRTIVENITALFSIKVFEYGISFLIFPYLVRALGPEKFGLMVFAQGVVQYFILVTNYGFNLTATRNIARARDRKERGKIFAAVLIGKGLLFLLATAVMGATLCFFSAMRQEWELYSSAYLLVIGNVLFPVWFFQGIEKMRYIAIINFIARLNIVLLVFYLVENEADYVLATLLQSLAPVISGIFSLGLCAAKYRYVFIVPHMKEVKEVLTEGWHVFVSTIAVNLYTASTVVILGVMTTPVVVGYFGVAKKLIEALIGMITPISQAIYPHISRLAAQSKEDALVFVRKCLLLFGSVNLTITLVLFFFAEPIVQFLLGTGYRKSISLLQIMSVLPFLVSLSNILGIQIMLPFGMQSIFSRIVIISAMLHMCLVIPLIYCFSGHGAATALVITECFVTVSMYYLLKRKNIII